MERLIKKARSGDKEAFVQLINDYKSDLYKVAHGFFFCEEDIADALQETILDAYEHIGQLKKTEYFKTWLIRILINNCSTLLAEKRKYIALDQSALASEGREDASYSNSELKQLLAALDEEVRLVVLLYYGEGYGVREIGEMLHVNENTVKSRLFRARKKLKGELE